MKFGVVLCPRCKTARGVRLESKTATCAKCSKKMNLEKAMVLCKVNSEYEVAQAVMEYNKKQMEKEDVYEHDIMAQKKEHNGPDIPVNIEPQEVYSIVAGQLVSIRGRDDKVVAAARKLCRYLGDFTESDLLGVLDLLGFYGEDACRTYITKLMENNVIYEPKTGMYRCV